MLGFFYALTIAYVGFFVGMVIVGMVRHQVVPIVMGLFMCWSFWEFWRRPGRILRRGFRRGRDRALKALAEAKTGER